MKPCASHVARTIDTCCSKRCARDFAGCPDQIRRNELLQVTDEILTTDPYSSSWWSSDALVVRHQTHLRRGDIPAAERALSMFGQMAREMRVREWIWHHDRMVEQRAMLAGQLDESERRFRELWVESRRLQLPYGAMLYVAQLDAISLERTGRRVASGRRTQAATRGSGHKSFRSTTANPSSARCSTARAKRRAGRSAR